MTQKTEPHIEDGNRAILKAFGIKKPTIKFELTLECNSFPKITHTYWEQVIDKGVVSGIERVTKNYELTETQHHLEHNVQISGGRFIPSAGFD